MDSTSPSKPLVRPYRDYARTPIPMAHGAKPVLVRIASRDEHRKYLDFTRGVQTPESEPAARNYGLDGSGRPREEPVYRVYGSGRDSVAEARDGAYPAGSSRVTREADADAPTITGYRYVPAHHEGMDAPSRNPSIPYSHYRELVPLVAGPDAGGNRVEPPTVQSGGAPLVRRDPVRRQIFEALLRNSVTVAELAAGSKGRLILVYSPPWLQTRDEESFFVKKTQILSGAVPEELLRSTIGMLSDHQNVVITRGWVLRGLSGGRQEMISLEDVCEYGSVRGVARTVARSAPGLQIHLCRAVACQLVAGLDFLLTKEHVGGADIKPQNLLVDLAGRVRLAEYDSINLGASYEGREPSTLSGADFAGFAGSDDLMDRLAWGAAVTLFSVYDEEALRVLLEGGSLTRRRVLEHMELKLGSGHNLYLLVQYLCTPGASLSSLYGHPFFSEPYPVGLAASKSELGATFAVLRGVAAYMGADCGSGDLHTVNVAWRELAVKHTGYDGYSQIKDAQLLAFEEAANKYVYCHEYPHIYALRKIVEISQTKTIYEEHSQQLRALFHLPAKAAAALYRAPVQ